MSSVEHAFNQTGGIAFGFVFQSQSEQAQPERVPLQPTTDRFAVGGAAANAACYQQLGALAWHQEFQVQRAEPVPEIWPEIGKREPAGQHHQAIVRRAAGAVEQVVQIPREQFAVVGFDGLLLEYFESVEHQQNLPCFEHR